MNSNLQKFIIGPTASNFEALKKIDDNSRGFLLVVENGKLLGTLTDGDVRRAFLSGRRFDETIRGEYTEKYRALFQDEGLLSAAELFKSFQIDFIPIIDRERYLKNLVLKTQLHSLLLQDIQVDLDYDFFQVDERLIDDAIYPRPWGFYKTTVMNEYFKAKIISVKPRATLSLQYHNHRQEYWLVVHGEGIVEVGDSSLKVSTGNTIFIPKGCKHRVRNASEKETLLISEVQTGEYFGEDDIIRLKDDYGRDQSKM